MLIAVDIGNTNLHLGLWHEDKWKLKWRARTVPNKMADEYAVLMRNFLRELDLGFNDVTGVVIASVVPTLTRSFESLAERYFKIPYVIVTHQTNMGIKIDIDSPAQAGADRMVNAAAIHALYGGGPAIVADFGTSTNFDVVSRDGAYMGGAISIGIQVAMDALTSRAARLFTVDLLPPPSAIGRNTTHAMQSGIFLGYLGLIEGLLTRLKNDFPDEKPEAVQIIGTGGLAKLFEEHTNMLDRVIDSLTLDGLRYIWELNQDK